MKTYTPRTPRATLGLAAAAMAAITMATMVVLPAELEAAAPFDETLASTAAVDAFVARRILEAEDMLREDQAEPAAFAARLSCVHAAEPGPDGS